MGFMDKLNDFAEKSYELGRTFSAEYIGGHPEISKKCKCEIKFKNDKIILRPGMFQTYEIDIKRTKAEFKTQEQISKDVTLTRLLLVGIFAFGLKKKRKNQLDYIVLKYDDEVLGEINVIFTGKKVTEIMKVFADFKKHALLNSDEVVKKKDEKEETRGSLEDLEKLAELKDKGILTEEEFEAKKKQILDI